MVTRGRRFEALGPKLGFEIRPIALLGPTDLAETGGADVYRLAGRRVVHGIALPTALLASVDGRACDGRVELLEDQESDATLLVGETHCALRLDGRHAVDAIDHGLTDEDAP